LQQHSAVSLPHGFLVYIQYADITAVTQNHGDSQKSQHTTKITVKATVIMNT